MLLPPLSDFRVPELGVAAKNPRPTVVHQEEVDEELGAFIARSRVGVPKGTSVHRPLSRGLLGKNARQLLRRETIFDSETY